MISISGILVSILIALIIYHTLLLITIPSASIAEGLHWSFCQNTSDYDKIADYMMSNGQSFLNQIPGEDTEKLKQRYLVLESSQEGCSLSLQSLNDRIEDIDLSEQLNDEIIHSVNNTGITRVSLQLMRLAQDKQETNTRNESTITDTCNQTPYVLFERFADNAYLIYQVEYDRYHTFSMYEWKTVSIGKNWYLCYELNELNHY